jgi:anti-repressor protein
MNDLTVLITNDSAATGKSSLTFISEPGLYALVLTSRKPEAKAFKRWITHEVMPAIRRQGIYATPEMTERLLNDPDTLIEALQALKKEREARAKLEAENEDMRPSVICRRKNQWSLSFSR